MEKKKLLGGGNNYLAAGMSSFLLSLAALFSSSPVLFSILPLKPSTPPPPIRLKVTGAGTQGHSCGRNSDAWLPLNKQRCFMGAGDSKTVWNDKSASWFFLNTHRGNVLLCWGMNDYDAWFYDNYSCFNRKPCHVFHSMMDTCGSDTQRDHNNSKFGLHVLLCSLLDITQEGVTPWQLLEKKKYLRVGVDLCLWVGDLWGTCTFSIPPSSLTAR